MFSIEVICVSLFAENPYVSSFTKKFATLLLEYYMQIFQLNQSLLLLVDV